MNFQITTSRTMFSVLAGLVFPMFSASATVVPAPVTGDLYLAFRAGGEPGGSESYIVKLGQDTPFRNAAAGTSFTVSGLSGIAVDLVGKYGADWYTRSDLYWGIFGVRPSASPIIYGSKKRSPVASVSTAWPTLDLTSRSTTATQISSVLENIGGYKGRTATLNNALATFQSNTADASSYNKQVATPGTNDFGSLSEWSSIEGDFGAGSSGTALDLYRIAGTGVTRVGSFTISNAAVVTFTAPAAASNVDTDGDGSIDSEEALAGTNPSNPSDFFRVQSVVQTPTGTGITFSTIPSRSYNIFYSQDLSSGSWLLINTVSGGASPTSLQYIDTDPVRKARATGFYKVGVTQ